MSSRHSHARVQQLACMLQRQSNAEGRNWVIAVASVLIVLDSGLFIIGLQEQASPTAVSLLISFAGFALHDWFSHHCSHEGQPDVSWAKDPYWLRERVGKYLPPLGLDEVSNRLADHGLL